MLSFHCKNIDFYKSLHYPIRVDLVSLSGTKSFFKASCPCFPNLSYCSEKSEEDALNKYRHILYEHIESLVSSGESVPFPERYGLFGLEFLSQLRNKYAPDDSFEPTSTEHLEWQEKLQSVYSDGRLADLVVALDEACTRNEISKNAVTTIVVNLGLMANVSAT